MEDINYGGPRKSERQSFVQAQSGAWSSNKGYKSTCRDLKLCRKPEIALLQALNCVQMEELFTFALFFMCTLAG